MLSPLGYDLEQLDPSEAEILRHYEIGERQWQLTAVIGEGSVEGGRSRPVRIGGAIAQCRRFEP